MIRFLLSSVSQFVGPGAKTFKLVNVIRLQKTMVSRVVMMLEVVLFYLWTPSISGQHDGDG
jgi:hypothetical protein